MKNSEKSKIGKQDYLESQGSDGIEVAKVMVLPEITPVSPAYDIVVMGQHDGDVLSLSIRKNRRTNPSETHTDVNADKQYAIRTKKTVVCARMDHR